MRFRRYILPFTLVIAALYGVLRPSRGAHAEADPVLDIFDGSRALKAHTLRAGGPDSAIVAALHNSDIGKAYAAINPGRSILMYDCQTGSIWCGRPEFSFPSLFTEASTLANPGHPDPNGLAKDWYAKALGLDGTLGTEPITFDSLAGARFQMLAIANRMDLAKWDGTNWSGGEIHFAYGLLPNGGAIPRLTLILEFEIRALSRPDFKSLAQVWGDLSNASDDDYAGSLVAALKASGFTLDMVQPTRTVRVRLRMNHEVQPGVWLLSQLVLDPAAADPAAHTTFTPARLNDQVGHRVNPDSKTYLALWRKVESVVGQNKLEYQIDAELLEDPQVEYRIEDEGLGTPPGVCNASETVRNVLSLEQCTWCHSTETGTEFNHVPNRNPAAAAVLSKFLAGQHPLYGATLHPDLTDLYYGNPAMVWVVKVPYQTYTGKPGAPCNVPADPKPTAVRKYHDVARRTLFLAALLKDSGVLFKGRPLPELFATPFTE